MWIGACTSSIGTWMQIVAQGWLIYRLSHSAFLLALDQFLGGIPIFLFSLIGGVVADRVERRRILLASQYVQMATALTLTILVATGLETYKIIRRRTGRGSDRCAFCSVNGRICASIHTAAAAQRR